MKKILKYIVVAILAGQVRKLRKRHQFKVVAVVGSIGKTSTKMAIAQTLGASLRVRYQQGNYNDVVTIPLVMFGEELPSLFNTIAWLGLFKRNSRQIRGEFPYDVVVLEYGSDGPGQIGQLARFGQVDIAVVTAITEEHMQSFADINAVAVEELAISKYANLVIYNSDLVSVEHAQLITTNSLSYSLDNESTSYRVANKFHGANGLEFDIKQGQNILVHATHEVVSDIQLYSVLGATVVGHTLGLKGPEIIDGIKAITPVSGRLRRLRGRNDSVLIDDTYNSSPEAVRLALQALYEMNAPQRIAVLGNMNELGDISESAHQQIGELCDPSKLSLVVTIGSQANNQLAGAAESRGCIVNRFEDPYSIGEFLSSKLESGAVLLLKGSQNGVFLEEAVKKLLADPEDSNKLVRQSDYWLRVKEKQFKRR